MQSKTDAVLYVAFCYASGEVGFGKTIPKGCLPIACGPLDILRERMKSVCRHTYDGKGLLVPGVPEAPDQFAAVDKLIEFMAWIRPSFAKYGLAVVDRLEQ